MLINSLYEVKIFLDNKRRSRPTSISIISQTSRKIIPDQYLIHPNSNFITDPLFKCGPFATCPDEFFHTKRADHTLSIYTYICSTRCCVKKHNRNKAPLTYMHKYGTLRTPLLSSCLRRATEEFAQPLKLFYLNAILYWLKTRRGSTNVLTTPSDFIRRD